MAILNALKIWVLWLLMFIRRILVISGFFGLMTFPISYDWAALLARVATGAALLPYGIKKFVYRQDAGKFPAVLFFSPRAGFYTMMAIEIIVPVCLLLGLFTRLAAAPAIIAFAFAVKASRGPCFTSPALVFFLMMLAIFFIGAGEYSLDYLLRLRLS